VPAGHHQALLDALERRGVVTRATVGRIVADSSGKILLTKTDEDARAIDLPEEIVDKLPHETAAEACCCAPAEEAETTCCAPAAEPGTSCCTPGAETPTSCRDSAPVETASCCASGAVGGAVPEGTVDSTAPTSRRAFGDLMRSAGADGAIDARTKELITFALTLLARCQPCVAAHLAKARQMGIAQTELDEAAWLAVAMGGAPVRLFYAEALEAEQAEQTGQTGRGGETTHGG
jgi:AhpD family alkylhydroperoxidase